MTDHHWRAHPGVRSGDERTLGERAADHMRAGMGSWTFIFGFVFLMVLWMGANEIELIKHWDPYPFILLNLALSTLAGLQGGILLIAAKRADNIAAQVAIHTSENTDSLIALLRQNTDLTESVHELVQAFHKSEGPIVG